MNKSNLNLYRAFYKSTVILNICVSFVIAFVTGQFFAFFAISYATLGLLAVFLYKEIAYPAEYYFYYNRGITKIKLIIFCFLVNIPLSTLIFTFLNYVALS